MKKIISLFKRDYDGTRQAYDEIVPGAEWVIAGEGVATEKVDGTCCMVRNNQLYKRYDAKKGKAPPEGFEPADEPDPVTGHWPGWLLVSDKPEDKWHNEGFRNALEPPDGTYELVGPKVQSNPHGFDSHYLVRHGEAQLSAPRTFAELREYLTDNPKLEGIVWHHPDGRMVKIKRKDFGLKWPDK